MNKKIAVVAVVLLGMGQANAATMTTANVARTPADHSIHAPSSLNVGGTE